MPDPADFTYRGRPFAAPGPPAPATPAQAASALERLEGTYRRLLRAYPRAYRHERGLEILTTLIDSAKPGQRRPARPPGWCGRRRRRRPGRVTPR